jgi:hypothetical protein
LLTIRKLWRKGRDLLPRQGFHFDRPVVLLQSDDWGRVGVRDREGIEQLGAAGVALGERAYDFYTLETAEDVAALWQTLRHHRDSMGRPPCLGMNFVQANLDFARMEAESFRQIHVLPLPDGLPQGWNRPGLFDAYRDGIAAGVFHPALHGTTHFCRRAVERHLNGSERGKLLRMLWRARTPYIYWRMPWIGYEYCDPEKSSERFLSVQEQTDLIGQAVGAFSRMFSRLPHSACAPGYRANDDTNSVWAQYGISVAQNGPGIFMAPHFDENEVLQLYRSIEFEPAVREQFSVEDCMRRAEECFLRGLPAIVSVHSINFHSSVKDFRSRTLTLFEQFLSALEAKYSELLYLHDREMFQLVQHGQCETAHGTVRVKVTKRNFRRTLLVHGVEA